MEALTFNYKDKILIVTLEDGTKKEYNDAASYLEDLPDRVADCKAVGWE